MVTRDDVKRKFQELFDSKETVVRRWNALVGDGAGVVTDPDNPEFTWVRYLTDQSKASKVVNTLNLALVEDVPVIVGRRFQESEYEEILAVDVTLYRWTMSEAAVEAYSKGRHGDDHNAASGTDPASIDLRNIVEMRGRPRTTPDLTVFVEKGQYVYGDTVKRFTSGSIDLTGSVPGVVGHRYVLVSVDGPTNVLASTNGTVVPLAVAPPIPSIAQNTIPICLVELSNGQTTITEDDVFDWRFLWSIISSEVTILSGTDAERLALTIGDLAEYTRFYTTDTDKIWEVWEGAWRLVFEPSGLSQPDGSAGTPLTVDNFGNLTNSGQDFVLDKGAGDSGSVLWRGGSNDDEIQIFLNDDAVAGDSDLEMNLADVLGDSKFIIASNGGVTQVFILDSLGNLFLLGNLDTKGDLTQTITDAVTNTVTDFQTLIHLTSGTAAAGFGIRHLWQLEDAGGATEDAAALTVEWEDAASASEDSLIRFYLRKAGVVLGEFFRFSGEGLRLPVGGTDIYPNIDGRGIAARWINPFTSLTSWTAHFRSGETTGPGNGTLTGYSWQGAPFGGAPVAPGYSINNDYFRAAGAAATKHFLATSITNAAASWQDKEISGRFNTGITTEIGVRFDANDDNNWVELFMTGVLADATQRLDFRYRDNGGAITTVTSNLIVPVNSFITIRLICTFSGGNYTANGVVVNEAGGSVNVTGFSHLLTGNWAVGPPTTGRAGIIVANAGNFGNCDWFWNTFT